MTTAQKLIDVCESLDINEESLSRSLYIDLTDKKEYEKKLGDRNNLKDYLSKGDQIALVYSNATAEVVKVVSFDKQPKGLPDKMVEEFGNQLKVKSKDGNKSMTLTEKGRGMLIGIQLGMSSRDLGSIDYESVTSGH